MITLTRIIHLLAVSAALVSADGDGANGNTGGLVVTGILPTTISLSNTGTDLPRGPSQTGCPTVTVTGELCSTCGIPACLGLATATQRCGCPETILTVTLDFPCEDNCEGVFCSTSWSYETETCGGPSVTDEPSATGTGSGGEGGNEEETSTTSSSLGTVTPNFGNKLAPFWVGLF